MSRIRERMRPGSNRTFLAKDFEQLRQQLIEHARIFFPDKIQDFSEPSLAGLLVDLAASVGDTMSFYLDHQFKELDPATAVEYANIVTHLRNAGVKIVGASPAAVPLRLAVNVPAESTTDQWQGAFRPKISALPFVFEDSSFTAANGIVFNLTEDLDFAEVNPRGELTANYEVSSRDEVTSAPATFTVYKDTYGISGNEVSETFTIPDTHEPFREIILGNMDVSSILSVVDAEGNTYYEVESLSHDTVFREVDNTRKEDFELVSKTLEVMPAPRRFVATSSPVTNRTTLRFGSGNTLALDDDIAPDPSELALDLYGKKTFSKFSIDPNSLIDTQTLGLSPRNTTITVLYRHGGGLGHNVDVDTITTINNLSLEFRKSPSPEDALSVRQSFTVTNTKAASGGTNSPSIEALRTQIAPSRNAQSRIVTREDLLSRIYTLPSRFGRVFRCGLSENPTSGLSILVHVISLDKNGRLMTSPDSLKENLSRYLNEFRLISDAIDVVDARVMNFKVRYEVMLDRTVNKQTTLLSINRALAQALDRRHFQIDQPIIIDDIFNVITNTRGVISIADLQVLSIGAEDENGSGEGFSSSDGGRVYSTGKFNTKDSLKNGILRADVGTIFELRYPDHDIVGYSI